METNPKTPGPRQRVHFKSHHSGMETGISPPSRPTPHLFKSHHSGMETLEHGFTWRYKLMTLNRTIVGWKHTHPARPQLQSAALNRTIVGWKLHTIHQGLPARHFKSHHSGMETVGSADTCASALLFKSHHSGMETQVRSRRQAQSLALNRTIVGWKQEWLDRCWRANRNFKSHHSGMETWLRGVFATSCPCFKSHHSGMETINVVRFPTHRNPLNRTIVGWKLGVGSLRNIKRWSFKSHHSGMETRGDAKSWSWRWALNRTIVGWKPTWGGRGIG